MLRSHAMAVACSDPQTARTTLTMHAIKVHKTRAILELRLRATLDFGLDSARPQLPERERKSTRTARERAMESAVQHESQQRCRATRGGSAAEAAERGSRQRCSAPAPSRRSSRRGRSPVGWGLDTPGARTQVAPSMAGRAATRVAAAHSDQGCEVEEG